MFKKPSISITELLFDFQKMIFRQLTEVFSFYGAECRSAFCTIQTIFILCSSSSHLTINNDKIITIWRKSYLKPGVLLIEPQT